MAKVAGICPTAGTWPGTCPVAAGTRTGARASGTWPRWPGCAPWPGHPHGRPQRCHGPWHGGLTPPAPCPSPVAVIGGEQSSDLRRDGVILQQEPFAGGGGHSRAGQGWSHRRWGDGEMGGRHRETAGTEEGRRGQRKAGVGTRRGGGGDRERDGGDREAVERTATLGRCQGGEDGAAWQKVSGEQKGRRQRQSPPSPPRPQRSPISW